MKAKRKRYGADFKAKVALEAIKGQRTINEIAGIGAYVREMSEKGTCRVCAGRNQFARTILEICDDYWPYRRPGSCTAERATAPAARSAYVDAVRKAFLAIGCGSGRFSASDKKTGAELEKRGIPLALVQDAILVGTCRKYIFDAATKISLAILRVFAS